MSKSSGYATTSKPQEVVTRDIERKPYDLSHWSFKTGHIGRLQTFSVIPVVAGDSIELNMSAVLRLSPLRHFMYLDAVVDLFAFYVPHRHVYGSNWTAFLKAGVDEGSTLGTTTFTGSNRPECLGVYFAAGQVLPSWSVHPYTMIWNNYFRDPQVDADAKTDATYLIGLTYPDPILKYGLPVCHLKRSWNTGVASGLSTADYSLALSGGEVDLYQMSQLKGRLQTEQARDWFAFARYRDILKYTWDSEVNIDADQRPELIMRSTAWLSGKDVDGTDDATLGSYTGKSTGIFNLSFPSRFFAEHGSIWIMGVVRFPPIVEAEAGYLNSKSEPTYKEISGDPSIIKHEPPISLNANEQFQGASSVDLGKIPYGQWYRESINMLSADYLEVSGHPFLLKSSITSRATGVYVVPSQYDTVFSDTLMGHWNSQAFVDVRAKRFIPAPEDSIFAGTI
ncbi:MAG: capsid protein [Microviridae sp.]|nr:MAG: capsid protein [Microviridae sp.]